MTIYTQDLHNVLHGLKFSQFIIGHYKAIQTLNHSHLASMHNEIYFVKNDLEKADSKPILVASM